MFAWGSCRRAAAVFVRRVLLGAPADRNGAPQVVVHPLLLDAALTLALLLGAEIGRALPRIAVDPMAHQGMRRVEGPLHGRLAVTVLAFGQIALGEFQIAEDALGVRPLPEQIIVLEEMIVAERGMRDHQRLHGRGIFLHDVADAGAGVDDHFIGEAAQALAVQGLVMREVLAEGPMPVEQRHGRGRIRVQHLLGRDHLDAVRVNVEAEFAERNPLDRVVAAPERAEVPVRAPVQQPVVRFRRDHDGSASVCSAPRRNSSRNTG